MDHNNKYNNDYSNHSQYDKQNRQQRRKPMSQGKSAYEIRASLLELAFKIATHKHHAESQAKAEKSGGDCYSSTSPTTEEVIAEAEKLNDFVSTQSSNSGYTRNH